MGILKAFQKAASVFAEEASQNSIIKGIGDGLSDAYHTSPAGSLT